MNVLGAALGPASLLALLVDLLSYKALAIVDLVGPVFMGTSDAVALTLLSMEEDPGAYNRGPVMIITSIIVGLLTLIFMQTNFFEHTIFLMIEVGVRLALFAHIRISHD